MRPSRILTSNYSISIRVNATAFRPMPPAFIKKAKGPSKRINLLNLILGAKVKAWDFSLAISNLLNHTYYTPSSMLMARNAEYAHADGRKVTLTATFKF